MAQCCSPGNTVAEMRNCTVVAVRHRCQCRRCNPSSLVFATIDAKKTLATRGAGGNNPKKRRVSNRLKLEANRAANRDYAPQDGSTTVNVQPDNNPSAPRAPVFDLQARFVTLRP